MNKQTLRTNFCYMTRTIIIYFLLLMTVQFFGQDNKLDRFELELLRLPDKERIDTLKHFLVQSFESNSQKTLYYINLLEKEAVEQESIDVQTYAKSKKFEYYAYQFETDSVFNYAEEAEEFARVHKQYKSLFAMQQMLLQRLTFQGDFSKAISKGREMYREAKDLDDSYCMAQATFGIGNVYKAMIMSEDALKYFNESLNILRLHDTDPFSNMRIKLDLYNFIADIYANQTFKPDSLIVYTDSIQIMIDRHKALEKKLNYDTFHFVVATNYANAYLEKKEFSIAKRYITKADSICNDDWMPSLSMILDQIKSNYFIYTKEYDKALVHIDRIIGFLEVNDLRDVGYYADKAKILAYLGRDEEAISLYTDLHEKMREQSIEQYHSQISQLRTLYDLDKLELQMEKDKLQISLMEQRISMFTVIFSLLFLIVLVIIIYMRRIKTKNVGLVSQIRKQDAIREELERLNEELEKKNLINQSEEQLSSNELHNQDALIYKLKSLFKEASIYTDPIVNRKILADKLGTNENYLRIAVKEKFGYTINEYINEFRINHAKKLLASEQYSIEEIAINSGFGTRSTMYRQFKDKYGLSPDEYRKSLKKL